MARLWQLDDKLSAAPTLSPLAFGQLLDALRSPEPARHILEFINHRAHVDYLSLVHYPKTLPRQIEGHSLNDGQASIVHRCFSIYQSHFSWADPIPREASRLRECDPHHAPITVHAFRQHEIPHEGWRTQIFEAHELAGRLTLLYTLTDGQVFGVNLYRHQRWGNFETREIERILDVAPLVRQMHFHLLGVGQRIPDTDVRVKTAEQRLRQLCPDLTPRERQVCARIACGITADGIAADLGIAPSTVITLRKRSYAKLGIVDRLGLARLVY